MKKLPSLYGLRAFEAAARHLSFTRAAEELCVTQGAISHQVQNLEAELHVKLFSRLPKNLKLTQAGELLYPPTHKAFSQIVEASRVISQKNSTFQIIIPPTFGTRWLIPRMHDFQSKNPDLKIQITTSTTSIDLKYDHNFDAVITTKKPRTKDFIHDHLFEEELYPVCSPKMITPSNPINCIEDLSNHCVLHSLPGRKEWKEWCKMMNVGQLKTIGEQCFELEESSIQAAIAGLGVALANIHFIHNEISVNALKLPFPKAPPLTLVSYGLTYHKTKRDFLPLRKFREWIIDEVALRVKDSRSIIQNFEKG